MNKSGVVAASAIAVFSGSVPNADARGMRNGRGWVEVPPEYAMPSQELVGPGHVIFFNRNGGLYKEGAIDSRTNTNGIGSGTLTAFNCGEANWQKVMTCLRETFAPFNVEITDVDPGTMPHSEVVVAGSPGEIGQPNGVAGVANLGCGVSIDNPVSFAFANIYYPECDTDDICWTAAQEIAHAYGLDHEIACLDPMTYDYACGTRKRFIDDLVQCGEDSQNQHACACTNAQKQNSFGTLLDIFGPRTNKPPTAEIDVPVDGATVQTGFAVTVTAKDDIRVTKVELFVDGSFYQRSELGGPTTWTFTTDSGLPGGNHSLVVVAYDAGGLTAQSAPVQITVEPPCSGNDDCDDGQVCNLASGQCVAGPGQPGGIGSTCTDNSACDSELCAQGPDGMRCVTLCTPGGNDCPDGFDCLGAGGGGACWPGADALDPPGDGGCGCTTGRHHGAGVASAFAFLFLAFAATRRRRSR